MSANPHKTDSAPSNQPGYVETDPFFNWAEEAWIIPCQAKLPKPLHGLCMYGPAFAVMLTLILTVALLAWCEERGKKKAPPVEEERIDPADGNKYDRASFVGEYGGVREWEAAKASCDDSPCEDSSRGSQESAWSSLGFVTVNLRGWP